MSEPIEISDAAKTAAEWEIGGLSSLGYGVQTAINQATEALRAELEQLKHHVVLVEDFMKVKSNEVRDRDRVIAELRADCDALRKQHSGDEQVIAHLRATKAHPPRGL